jgi:hypothetical protein
MKPTAPRPARKAKPTTPAAPPLPDFALRPARPFPKKAIEDPVAFHDLGPVVSPADQARAKHADEPPDNITPGVCQSLAALTGSGPRQTPPHSDTAIILGEAIDRLRDHALDGDTDAFLWLGNTLNRAVADFQEVARRHPAIAAAWGAKQNTIPANVGRNPGHAADLETAFARFDLGSKSPYRVNPESRRGGHTFDTNTPANALAAGLCEHLANHRARARLLRPPVPRWAQLAAVLPELTAATARVWKRAAWELLLSSVENERELVRLCPLGDVRAMEVESSVSPQISAIKNRLYRAIQTLASY